MVSMRSIKRRISSVHSTQQITRAMYLVATSKLQKCRSKLETLRPFVEETIRITRNITAYVSDTDSIYFEKRPINNTAVIVISADRGLCGGYNVNVAKAASAIIKETAQEHLITVGTKSRDYFRKRYKNIIRTYQGVSESPFYEDAADIGLLAADLFESGEADEVYLVYTVFNSALSYTPNTLRLLPLEISPDKTGGYMDFDPDQKTFLSYIVPKYISTVIYGAMVESAACLQGARMSSMDSATKNSSHLLSKFTLKYNRARQDAITQELTEIISGADAL